MIKSGKNTQEKVDIPDIIELKEVFDLMDDWEDRYRYLIDLGSKLPLMDEYLKNDQTKVEGCTSQVWMVLEDTPDGSISFLADSDAHIVRGLIAVLYAMFYGVTRENARDIDVEQNFKDLGLESHISPNRRNGFFAMVSRLRTLAG